MYTDQSRHINCQLYWLSSWQIFGVIFFFQRSLWEVMDSVGLLFISVSFFPVLLSAFLFHWFYSKSLSLPSCSLNSTVKSASWRTNIWQCYQNVIYSKIVKPFCMCNKREYRDSRNSCLTELEKKRKYSNQQILSVDINRQDKNCINCVFSWLIVPDSPKVFAIA